MATIVTPAPRSYGYSIIAIFAILGIIVSCTKNDQEIPMSSYSIEDSVVLDYGSVEIKCQISGKVSANNLEVEYADNPSLNQSTIVQSERVGNDSFSTTINNVKVNTTYYYRYVFTNAINSITDTKIRSFNSFNYSAPVVNTGELKRLKGTTAILNGSIQFTSGEKIIEKGFLFGEQKNSLTKMVCTKNSFDLEVSELKCGTKYYYQAYVLSEVGEGKGEIMSFKTGDIEQPFHYLTFKNASTNNADNSLTLYNTGGNAPVLYYSTDALNWYKWNYSSLTFTDTTPIYLCGDNKNGFSHSADSYSRFSCSKGFECSGNIMSLIDKDNALTTIPSNYCFYSLFASCIMYNAPTLPATTLKNDCYAKMFKSTYILSFPTLPATELADYCYQNMFEGCKYPSKAPMLPAEELSKGCYASMFLDCSNIVTPPSWSVKKMADRACEYMFKDCKSLTSIIWMNNIELSTSCCEYMYSGCTSLTSVSLPYCGAKKNCYYGMFKDCTGIQTASLASPRLVDGCYNYMFNGCSSLSTVQCYAYFEDDFSTYKWMEGVSTSGTFVKVSDATFWERGVSGIPSGWTINSRDW